MEDKMMIPFVVHEADMERLERTNKRLWILSILLVLMLVGTNAGWIWYENQFEEITTTTTQSVVQDADDNGENTFVEGDYYGQAKDQN